MAFDRRNSIGICHRLRYWLVAIGQKEKAMVKMKLEAKPMALC